MKRTRLYVTVLLLVALFSLSAVGVNAAADGWKENGNSYNYYKSGQLLTGWRTIDSQMFYFKKTGGTGVKGMMYTGWINDQAKGATYYFKKTGGAGVKGRMYTGWISDNAKGATYYFKNTGAIGIKGTMYTGWINDNAKGATYYFKKTGGNGVKGSMYVGWINDNAKDATYYFKKTGGNGVKGTMYVGWINDNAKGATYYFKKTGGAGVKGKMYTGWINDNAKGTTYYFKETGSNGVKGQLLTGWQTIGENRFYFKETGGNGTKGTMLTGWQTLDGKEYYFNETGETGTKGKMLTNTTVDGKTLGPDGAVVSEPEQASYTVYYYLEDAPHRLVQGFSKLNCSLEEKLTFTETVGTTVTAPIKSYDNYVLRSSDSNLSAVLGSPSWESTSLRLYYERTTASAKIERYRQNVDGNGYTLAETEEFNLKWGTEIRTDEDINAYVHEGFSWDVDNIRSGYVEADGSLVLKAYYDRVEHDIEVIRYLEDPNNPGTYIERLDTYNYGGLHGQTITENSVPGISEPYYTLDLSIPGTMNSVVLGYNSEPLKLYYKCDKPESLEFDENASREVFRWVNSYCESKGLEALEWDDTLYLKTAKINAGYNALHHGESGIDDSQHHVLGGMGYGGYGAMFKEVVDEWEASPDSGNMLNSNDVSGAVAVVTGSDRCGRYWRTQILVTGPRSVADNALMTDTELDEYFNSVFIEEGSINIPKEEWSKYMDLVSIT